MGYDILVSIPREAIVNDQSAEPGSHRFEAAGAAKSAIDPLIAKAHDVLVAVPVEVSHEAGSAPGLHVESLSPVCALPSTKRGCLPTRQPELYPKAARTNSGASKPLPVERATHTPSSLNATMSCRP
jgi:hypothetical protein